MNEKTLNNKINEINKNKQENLNINNNKYTLISSNPHLKQLTSSRTSLNTILNLQRQLTITTPKLTYRRRRGEIKTLIHWGQRKLMINEIEFLTKYSNLSKICLYIGSAPGIHITYLSKLFPTLKFILIDPAIFQCNETNNIIIRNEYMTDEIAYEYKNQNILFISDIRSADWKLIGNDNLDDEIIHDMNNQMKWHDIMNPVASMLKFRLPWKPGITNYLNGDIYLPVWGTQTTTESRLVVTNHERKDWNHQEYWEQMFYFNNVIRCSAYDHNIPIEYHIGSIITPTVLSYDQNNFNHDILEDNNNNNNNNNNGNNSDENKISCCIDYCYDCSAEILILQNYLRTRLQNENINDDEGLLIDEKRTFLRYNQLNKEEIEQEIRAITRYLIDKISESCLSKYHLTSSLQSDENNNYDNDNDNNNKNKNKKKRKKSELNEMSSFHQTIIYSLDLLRNCIRYPFNYYINDNQNHDNNDNADNADNNNNTIQQILELKNNSFHLWINMIPPNMSDLSPYDIGERGMLGIGYNIPSNCALDIWLWRLLESTISIDSICTNLLGSNLQDVNLDNLQLTEEYKFELFSIILQKYDQQIENNTNKNILFPVIILFTDIGQTYLFHSNETFINKIFVTQFSLPPSITQHLPTICFGYIYWNSILFLSWNLYLSNILVFYGLKKQGEGTEEDLRNFINITFDRSISWRNIIIEQSGLTNVDIYSLQVNKNSEISENK